MIEILSRVESSVFQQFQESPEEFIAQAERLILNVKETAIFGKYHISYVRRKIYKRYFYTADDSGKTGSGRNESREAFV